MHLVELIQRALMEDVGAGDITTLSTIPVDSESIGVIRAKQELIVCGHEPAKEVFRQVGAIYIPLVEEGTLVSTRTKVAQVEGNSRAILTGERLALNFLMKLCGIATHTYRTVEGVSGLRVVDTRKTTPLLRYHERRAVRMGGGHNHRFALYDGILIKDNHITACGSITKAVQAAKQNAHHLLKIEVEVESLEAMEEAIQAGADVVMLDNMNNEEYREAIAVNQGRVLIEASGNMDRERILEIQDIGLDVVSMGGLIHQATWADLSMKFN